MNFGLQKVRCGKSLGRPRKRIFNWAQRGSGKLSNDPGKVGLAQAILSKNCWLWLGTLLGGGRNTFRNSWIQPHIVLQWQGTRSGWDSPQDALNFVGLSLLTSHECQGSRWYFTCFKGEPKDTLQSLTYHTSQRLSGKFILGCHKAGWSSSLWFRRNTVVLFRFWNEGL